MPVVSKLSEKVIPITNVELKSGEIIKGNIELNAEKYERISNVVTEPLQELEKSSKTL